MVSRFPSLSPVRTSLLFPLSTLGPYGGCIFRVFDPTTLVSGRSRTPDLHEPVSSLYLLTVQPSKDVGWITISGNLKSFEGPVVNCRVSTTHPPRLAQYRCRSMWHGDSTRSSVNVWVNRLCPGLLKWISRWWNSEQCIGNFPKFSFSTLVILNSSSCDKNLEDLVHTGITHSPLAKYIKLLQSTHGWKRSKGNFKNKIENPSLLGEFKFSHS
jgi:hypothetical protein